MFISYIYTRLFFSFEKRPGGEPERFFRMLWIKTSSFVIVCRFPFVCFFLYDTPKSTIFVNRQHIPLVIFEKRWNRDFCFMSKSISGVEEIFLLQYLYRICGKGEAQ